VQNYCFFLELQPFWQHFLHRQGQIT